MSRSRRWRPRVGCRGGMWLTLVWVWAGAAGFGPASGPLVAGVRERAEVAALLDRLESLAADPAAHLAEIAVLADRGARLAEGDAAVWATLRESVRRGRPLVELEMRELEIYYQPPAGNFSRRDQRGFEALRRLSADAAVAASGSAREERLGAVREIAFAVVNNRRTPMPGEIDLAGFIGGLWDQIRNPVGIGRSPATNLAPDIPEGERDRFDPPASSFWTPPASIGSRDLYHGFGRDRLPPVEEVVWEYAGPKTSYGGNPGFDLRSRLGTLKVKFGETVSEPFTARIFWALGYCVEPTDHARRLRVRYDRRLFREFHLRRELETRFFFIRPIPVFKLRLQRRWDPFVCIDHAVLRDGTRVDAATLRSRLLLDPGKVGSEKDATFRPEFEGEIDHLVMVAANVQFRTGEARSVGPWDFGQLDHGDRRELRGMALLAAWLGWYDSRFENTRLKLTAESDGFRMQHVVSDLGGGLGRGGGFFSGVGELPEKFGWTFTRPGGGGKPGRGRIRIKGFKPMEDTVAFERMTWEDARWMARWIGRLTESQIEQALVGAGLDSARARLYREKLVSRRDAMIEHLGLSDEVGLLRRGGVVRRFDYDPEVEGPLGVVLPDGTTRNAPVSGRVRVEAGRLVERRGREPSEFWRVAGGPVLN